MRQATRGSSSARAARLYSAVLCGAVLLYRPSCFPHRSYTCCAAHGSTGRLGPRRGRPGLSRCGAVLVRCSAVRCGPGRFCGVAAGARAVSAHLPLERIMCWSGKLHLGGYLSCCYCATVVLSCALLSVCLSVRSYIGTYICEESKITAAAAASGGRWRLPSGRSGPAPSTGAVATVRRGAACR